MPRASDPRAPWVRKPGLSARAEQLSASIPQAASMMKEVVSQDGTTWLGVDLEAVQKLIHLGAEVASDPHMQAAIEEKALAAGLLTLPPKVDAPRRRVLQLVTCNV